MSSVEFFREFVSERLTAAAEEIFKVFAKTIVEYEEEIDRQRRLLDINWKPEIKLHRIAADPLLTNSSVKREEVLQKTQEASHLCIAEVRGSFQTTADTENVDGNGCSLHITLKELGDDSQTQKVIFPSLEVVKIEPDQPEIQVPHMQPVSSVCSAAQRETSGSEEESVQSEGRQTKKKRQKVSQISKQEGQEALPDGDSPAESQKYRCVCSTCGKGFHSILSFKEHIKTHKISKSVMKRHLQQAQKKRFVCDICRKEFRSPLGLQQHLKMHTGIKDFECEDCGKTFVQKWHLTAHMRTHTEERPFSFVSCGKHVYTHDDLEAHLKHSLGQKPYSCDICDFLS